MTELMNAYSEAFSVFLGGMPEDVISLVVVGLALATELLFFSIPFLLVKGR